MSNKETNTDPFPFNEGEYLVMVNELKKVFYPEFVNRIDEIIVFESLTEDDLCKIVDFWPSRFVFSHPRN